MSKSAFPGSPDHAATLRRMNILVVLLVISNIVTGVLSVYLLRKVDRRYSELIMHSVPVLNDLQTLTAQSTEAMRATNPVFFRDATEKLEPALQLGRASLEADRNLRDKLLKAEWLPETSAKRLEFQQAGEAFTRLGAEVLGLFKAGKSNEAIRVREESLHPAFEKYQRAITKIADLLQDESMVANNDFSAKTSSLSTIVLGVAGWPLIVLMGLLLLTVCFVVVLMFVFRGKELGDMP